MQLEQICARQIPHIIESLLGSLALGPGNPRFHQRRGQTGRERHQHQGRRRDSPRVPPHELGTAVSERVLAGGDRQPLEMPSDVIRQLADGGIALVGRFANRLHHDVVEIAGQATGQLLGRVTALAADPGGGQASCFALAHDLLRPPDCRARSVRLRFENGPGNLVRHRTGRAPGAVAGEELVEDQTERMDVSGGRDGITAELLRARILGRHQPPGPRRRGLLPSGAGRENFCDPEVQQLGCSFGRDQNVAGLDVAMDDEMLVRILNG